MSLPGIFTPVRSGGHIYVDGGLLNNFPVSVARAMGAQYVLGINLETAPLDPDASLSSFAVLSQSIDTVVAANEQRAMEDANMVVTVNLRKYSSMDFANEEKSSRQVMPRPLQMQRSYHCSLSTKRHGSSIWRSVGLGTERQQSHSPSR